MAIDLTRAERIDGFMSVRELEWLARQARTMPTIVEVGCFIGRSTRALADHALGVVYAVDLWESGWRDEMRYADPSAYEVVQRYPDPLHTFVYNLSDCSNVFIYRGSLQEMPHLRADMVFIDGSHDYDSVARDIDRALQLLTIPARRRVGLLCGHDYASPIWPAVSKAVDTVAGPVQVLKDESIWWREV